jgi:hypothetical protein
MTIRTDSLRGSRPRATERPWRLMGVASTLLVVAGLSRPGRADASEPAGTYSVPTQVDLLPDAEHPTEVVLHGVFFQLLASGRYGNPQCGRMHFVCASGQSDMCALQWRELEQVARAGSSTLCHGFGTLSKVSTASVTAEASPLGAPDTWDLGIGITTGVYVDGQCAVAHALRCSGDASGGAGGTPESRGGAGGQPSQVGGAGGLTGSAGHGVSAGGSAGRAAQAGYGGGGGTAAAPGGGVQAGAGGGGGAGPRGGTVGLGTGGSTGTGGAGGSGAGASSGVGASGCQLEGPGPGVFGSGVFGVMVLLARALRKPQRKRPQ